MEKPKETISRLNENINRLYKNKEYDQLYEVLKEKYRLMKKLYGEKSIQSIDAMNEVAIALYIMKQYDKARVLLRCVLDLRTAMQGRFHKDRIAALRNLRNIMNAKFSWAIMPELLKTERELCLVSNKLLGRDAEETIEYYHDYAMDLYYDKQYEKALECAGENFGICYKKFGLSDAATQKAVECLRKIISKTGCTEKKIQYQTELFDRYRALYGMENDTTLELMLGLCQTLFENNFSRQDSFYKAKALLLAKQCAAFCEKRYGLYSEKAYLATEMIAKGYEQSGVIQEACAYQRDLCERASQQYGAGHFDTGTYISKYIELLIKAGNTDQARSEADRAIPALMKKLKTNEKTILHIRAMLARAGI